MTTRRACCYCGAEGEAAEHAAVASNVRRWGGRRFGVWRCGACGSIHAAEEADLDDIYCGYPFQNQKLGYALRRCYGVLLRRLRRAGLDRDDSVLDYGCGSGHLVRHLRQSGYARAAGYDAYTPGWDAPDALAGRYAWVLAQDLIEHAEAPVDMLRTLGELAQPGGRVVIGAPNAAGIDLRRPGRDRHSLHQPYHRHIPSRRALVAASERLGWRLERFWRTPYTNTPHPFLNTRFLLHYFRCFDDTVDVAFEASAPLTGRLATPATLILGFLGALGCPPTEMQAIFRTPEAGEAS
ncbi:MAG: methyltransferase domain-containing protein [Phycisphaerae bacterium]|nr:methyltransferase domain-containing protein [Phycisphaerae bacterium]